MKGHVYIIQMLGTNYYKIGMTAQENPYKRIEAAKTYAPLGIKEIKIIESVYPYKLEKELHKDFKHKRKNGEWFELDTNDLKLIEDKYSVSQGKLLKTLEKCLHLFDSEELLYSVLKSTIQGKESKSKVLGNTELKQDCIDVVNEKFKNQFFSSSDVVEILKLRKPKYKNITPRGVGTLLRKIFPMKAMWIDGKTKRCYFNEKN